jgi:hypothetical protein
LFSAAVLPSSHSQRAPNGISLAGLSNLAAIAVNQHHARPKHKPRLGAGQSHAQRSAGDRSGLTFQFLCHIFSALSVLIPSTSG